jgi:uncharacterized NAD(P)/FAD-binding protein YdhS
MLMPQQTIRDVIIIGGGASATLIAWNLARHHNLRSTIVDPSNRPAFGLAYATPSLKNLLNVAAGGMSADPDDADHFVRWMQENVAADTTSNTFVPRAIFGLYLRQLHCAAGPEHVRDTAIECRRVAGAYAVAMAGGAVLRARQVVLACGHLTPARLPGIPIALDATGRYHHDAWGEGVFAAIGTDDDVALIGTGLTTVDVVLRLRENGHRGRIIALSRRGQFPERHAPYAPLPAPVIEPGTTPPTTLAYLRAFHLALRRETDWRAAVDSVRPVANDLWLALPDVEKRRFRRHLQRRWEVRRHRMAPKIADIIDAERRAGSLQVRDGHVTTVAIADNRLRVTARRAGDSFEIVAGHVINCTGPSLNYRNVGSPLLRAMMDAGDIVPGFAGAGLRCTRDGALLDCNGDVAVSLFSIGPSRLGVLFESIAIPEIREQARDLASLLADRVAVQSIAA